jgi:hypothetical protein
VSHHLAASAFPCLPPPFSCVRRKAHLDSASNSKPQADDVDDLSISLSFFRSARPWPFPNAHHVSCGRASESLAISAQVSVASDSLHPCLRGLERPPPVSLSCCLRCNADSYKPASTLSRYISADGNTTSAKQLISRLRCQLILPSTCDCNDLSYLLHKRGFSGEPVVMLFRNPTDFLQIIPKRPHSMFVNF